MSGVNMCGVNMSGVNMDSSIGTDRTYLHRFSNQRLLCLSYLTKDSVMRSEFCILLIVCNYC